MLELPGIASDKADMIIFGAIGVVVLVVFITLQAGDSIQTRMKSRIKKLQKRRNSSPNLINETKMTLRRHIAEEPGGLVGILLKPFPNITKLQDKLNRAGYKDSNAKMFLLKSLVAIVICVSGMVAIEKHALIGLAIGLVIGLWLPIKVLNYKINTHMKKFLRFFPDAIDLIVRGLRSGLPIGEGINIVGNEVPDPVGEVFRHIADSMKLGVPMEKALQDMARQLGNTEFNFFTTSIILQRETGGNLGEILGNLSDVLRKRYTMQLKIKAMTSESRASATIIGCLPFFVSVLIHFLSPGYLNILWEERSGTKMLLLACVMLWIGITTMKRMGKFEI